MFLVFCVSWYFLVIVILCCQYRAVDGLGRPAQKWPIMCRERRSATAHSLTNLLFNSGTPNLTDQRPVHCFSYCLVMVPRWMIQVESTELFVFVAESVAVVSDTRFTTVSTCILTAVISFSCLLKAQSRYSYIVTFYNRLMCSNCNLSIKYSFYCNKWHCLLGIEMTSRTK